MDPMLYERAKASLNNNMHVVYSLGEIDDDIRNGSIDALESEAMISKIWSKDSQLEQDLKDFVRASHQDQDEHNTDLDTVDSRLPTSTPHAVDVWERLQVASHSSIR